MSSEYEPSIDSNFRSELLSGFASDRHYTIVSALGVCASDETYRRLQNLPQFPALATKLLRLLSHDEVEVSEIVGLIRADAALASELLRIVNSPVYAFPCRISSIQSAVALLGFSTVKTFALTVSMRGFLQTSLRLDLLRKVWRYSLACALLGEELSIACSPVRRADDRVYTACLLHDIGRLGLLVAHPQEYSVLLTEHADGGSDFLEWERETFGIDHCEAGRWLALEWRFSDELLQVTASHHAPVETPFTLVDTVRVAVLLAGQLGFDIVPGRNTRSFREILSLLPQSAQYRVDTDETVLKSKIIDRLDFFD